MKSGSIYRFTGNQENILQLLLRECVEYCLSFLVLIICVVSCSCYQTHFYIACQFLFEQKKHTLYDKFMRQRQ